MSGSIQYLNTDLDLKSSNDLSGLTAALESSGVFPLHVECGEDGNWHGTFETDIHFEEPEQTIAVMLSALESLAPSCREAWEQCFLRELNVGYDCGDKPWAFNQGLSKELLGRMANAGTSLRVTLYSPSTDTS